MTVKEVIFIVFVSVIGSWLSMRAIDNYNRNGEMKQRRMNGYIALTGAHGVLNAFGN